MNPVSFIPRTHPQQGPNPKVDDRATAWEVFEKFNARFRFTIDVAANAHNTKLPRYFSPTSNGLERSWAGERVWCNPPYSSIRPWVEKALGREADLTVLLLPANRTEQGWWQDLIEPGRLAGSLGVEFLRGRMRFIAATDTQIKPNQRPPFGVCLVIVKEQQ
jgi:phage N-6-adenine-methyltransferase